jgi:hypothetical protein
MRVVVKHLPKSVGGLDQALLCLVILLFTLMLNWSARFKLHS